MSKTYKGYELYKMIAENKIKEGTKFKANQYIIKFNGDNFVFANSERILFRHSDKKVAEMDFELIEDDIDIQSIKKLNESSDVLYGQDARSVAIENRFLINEILEAVKQIDRNKEDKQC